MEINKALHDFLQENETGVYSKKGELIAFVHVHFCDLEEFTEMLGYHNFDEGGMEVTLCYQTVVVELNDIFEGYGHTILDYKDCFYESELRGYEKELAALAELD